MAKKHQAASEAAPKCPITLEQFRSGSKPILITLGSGSDARQIVASPKEFSTGSFGWYAGDKVVVMIDGVPVKVQLGLNMTVVGSKELPK